MIPSGSVADVPSAPVLLGAIGLVLVAAGLAALVPAWIATAIIGPRGARFRMVPASVGAAAGIIAYLIMGPALDFVPIGGAVVGGATLGAILQRAVVGESGHDIGLVWRAVGGLVVGGSIGGALGVLAAVAASSLGALPLMAGLGATVGALIAARPRLSSLP